MEKYIINGEMPVFGYPLVCFSPVAAQENENRSFQKKKNAFWHKLFKETIRNKKPGHRNQIVKVIDKFDEFEDKHSQMLKDFTKGRYNN